MNKQMKAYSFKCALQANHDFPSVFTLSHYIVYSELFATAFGIFYCCHLWGARPLIGMSLKCISWPGSVIDTGDDHCNISARRKACFL